MDNLLLETLQKEYQRLRHQVEKGQLTSQQYQESLEKLMLQDERGVWWTVDPTTGRYLYYDVDHWVALDNPFLHLQAKTGNEKEKPDWRSTIILVSLIVPILTAIAWWAYTSLPASSEGMDLGTPLIIAGVPLLLYIFHQPLDGLLRPFHGFLRLIPRPMLWVIALALPIVISLVVSNATISGYGSMRFLYTLGVLLPYILLRKPEVMQ
ncbi:MAG: hypothetical protein HPY59_12270 [Anaerolineae bacterium]|nr:hypothetical protein [Anaerolineae bacterium]